MASSLLEKMEPAADHLRICGAALRHLGFRTAASLHPPAKGSTWCGDSLGTQGGEGLSEAERRLEWQERWARIGDLHKDIVVAVLRMSPKAQALGMFCMGLLKERDLPKQIGASVRKEVSAAVLRIVERHYQAYLRENPLPWERCRA